MPIIVTHATDVSLASSVDPIIVTIDDHLAFIQSDPGVGGLKVSVVDTERSTLSHVFDLNQNGIKQLFDLYNVRRFIGSITFAREVAPRKSCIGASKNIISHASEVVYEARDNTQYGIVQDSACFYIKASPTAINQTLVGIGEEHINKIEVHEDVNVGIIIGAKLTQMQRLIGRQSNRVGSDTTSCQYIDIVLTVESDS